MRMPDDPDCSGRRHSLRKRRCWRIALIWTAVLGAIAVAWAAQDIAANSRGAGDPHQQPAMSSVSAPGPSSGGRPGGAAMHRAPESDADRFFRACMLPGAAVLVVVIASALVAIFFPKFEPE
jgi:hypothetical protein